MARTRKPSPFGPSREPAGQGNGRPGKPAAGQKAVGAAKPRQQQVIPDAVAGRMARRVAVATGIPTALGMAVFVVSYILVSRQVLDIPPAATLVTSGAFFLLGLVGLSYGVLSAGWEDAPGSLLGFEQIPLNLGRMRASVRAMREGGAGSGPQA